jgi:hypothetical protein
MPERPPKSTKVAKTASKTMRDGRTGNDSKTAAGSALSQKEKGKGSGGGATKDKKK